ncbi:hypothetical protein [Neorhizobium sp. JUb45]|uniref:hypothetical protein n=1 Tax=unclassified Neorhizobium TaxID=2629175 RepID=UPI0010495C67|nr:hypothetical protein [Neorhizobium sp. JUb45]TCR00413.1 hypothetical protein EDF70_10626 [Neorhizobium sp. JUb45]
MGRKLTSVYDTLVRGLIDGLCDHELYDFVTSRCDSSSDKRICRASIMAMSDDRVSDRDALERVYSIAADHRLRCAG